MKPQELFLVTTSIVEFLLFRKRKVAGIELTSRCNLRCPMCYWWLGRPKKELDDKEMIKLFKRLRRQGIIYVVLAGGEPTLRSNLIQIASKIFPYTMVFTNGSSSPKDTPPLPNNFYLVSVDGLEKTHDKIRAKGLYKKIWKNFSGRSDCFTSTTITRLNKDEIEELVAEWSKTKIGGMIFYFATPIKGEKNDIFLNWEEKEEVIERLLELKEKYQDFLLVTKKMLDLLRQDEVERWSRRCPVEWATVTYAADGSVKKPCVIGKEADCSKCGSWMAIFLESLMKFDRESFSFIKKSLSIAGNN